MQIRDMLKGSSRFNVQNAIWVSISFDSAQVVMSPSTEKFVRELFFTSGYKVVSFFIATLCRSVIWVGCGVVIELSASVSVVLVENVELFVAEMNSEKHVVIDYLLDNSSDIAYFSVQMIGQFWVARWYLQSDQRVI